MKTTTRTTLKTLNDMTTLPEGALVRVSGGSLRNTRIQVTTTDISGEFVRDSH